MRLPESLPPAPLQRLHLDWLDAAGIELAVLRLDLVDPLISGNKWFKLHGHLRQAAADGARGVISLGGAHSNHLHALAAAGRRCGFATVGLMRGHPQDTPTVRDLQAFGMELHWLGFGGYRARHEPGFWAPWQQRYPEHALVSEGGGGLLGTHGCLELVGQAEAGLEALGWDDFDGWWLACGTGTTLAGLVLAERGRRPVHGALAVPWDHGVPEQVAALAGEAGYRLVEACRRGFGQFDEELLAFIEQVPMPLEPVYTGKALMALRERLADFVRGTRLVFVHTGGMQGWRSA